MNRQAAPAIVAVLAAACAHAAPRCSVPPYGASEWSFRVWERTMESVVPASLVFPPICRAKFEGIGRPMLGKLLGLTQAQVAQEDVATLALRETQVIWASSRHGHRGHPAGVYAAFPCDLRTGACFRPGRMLLVFRTKAACLRYIASIEHGGNAGPITFRCLFRPDRWQSGR